MRRQRFVFVGPILVLQDNDEKSYESNEGHEEGDESPGNDPEEDGGG